MYHSNKYNNQWVISKYTRTTYSVIPLGFQLPTLLEIDT